MKNEKPKIGAFQHFITLVTDLAFPKIVNKTLKCSMTNAGYPIVKSKAQK